MKSNTLTSSETVSLLEIGKYSLHSPKFRRPLYIFRSKNCLDLGFRLIRVVVIFYMPLRFSGSVNGLHWEYSDLRQNCK